MRSSKLKITNLITKIEESLPDGNDVCGYQGINKQMLIQSLKDTHALLSCFNDYKDMFEVIFMKRNIAANIDWCYNFLKSNEINADNFNDFLHQLNNIRHEIKTTYILVSQNPLRIDSEIAEAKELLADLKKDIDEITTIKQEIAEARDSSSTIIQSLGSENTKAEENCGKISELITKFEEASQKIETSSSNINTWEKNIETCEENIGETKLMIDELLQEFEKTKALFEEQQSGIKEQIDKQGEIITKNEEHQKEIQATLEGASKHGLAGSFYTRKKELGWNIWFWVGGTIMSILLLVAVSYILIVPLIENPDNFDIKLLLARIPVFSALVWLGWFCAKQYGFTSRIREEYAFKYAIAMAFEGYKKESLEVNQDLLDNLLRLTLSSVAVSPVSYYDAKNNHGTPVNEITESLMKEIKPLLSDLTKKGIEKL